MHWNAALIAATILSATPARAATVQRAAAPARSAGVTAQAKAPASGTEFNIANYLMKIDEMEHARFNNAALQFHQQQVQNPTAAVDGSKVNEIEAHRAFIAYLLAANRKETCHAPNNPKAQVEVPRVDTLQKLSRLRDERLQMLDKLSKGLNVSIVSTKCQGMEATQNSTENVKTSRYWVEKDLRTIAWLEGELKNQCKTCRLSPPAAVPPSVPGFVPPPPPTRKTPRALAGTASRTGQMADLPGRRVEVASDHRKVLTDGQIPVESPSASAYTAVRKGN